MTASGRGGRPRCVSRGAKVAWGLSADQMVLGVEGVVDGGVGGAEPPGGGLALPTARRVRSPGGRSATAPLSGRGCHVNRGGRWRSNT